MLELIVLVCSKGMEDAQTCVSSCCFLLVPTPKIWDGNLASRCNIVLVRASFGTEQGRRIGIGINAKIPIAEVCNRDSIQKPIAKK